MGAVTGGRHILEVTILFVPACLLSKVIQSVNLYFDLNTGRIKLLAMKDGSAAGHKIPIMVVMTDFLAAAIRSSSTGRPHQTQISRRQSHIFPSAFS